MNFETIVMLIIIAVVVVALVSSYLNDDGRDYGNDENQAPDEVEDDGNQPPIKPNGEKGVSRK